MNDRLNHRQTSIEYSKTPLTFIFCVQIEGVRRIFCIYIYIYIGLSEKKNNSPNLQLLVGSLKANFFITQCVIILIISNFRSIKSRTADYSYILLSFNYPNTQETLCSDIAHLSIVKHDLDFEFQVVKSFTPLQISSCSYQRVFIYLLA